MSLTCACDRCAVQATLARYHHAGDRRRIEELAATFTEDGILDTREWRAEGRAGIVARLKSLMGRSNPALSTVRHNLASILIEPEADGVMIARSYFLVTTNIGLDHTGDYFDRLFRVDGVWLIAERKVRLNWVSPDTLFDIQPR